ncbi:Uncharacterised protein [Vibrio cholerae]|nr:Uncharacterised protein [Vibrio cholerae]
MLGKMTKMPTTSPSFLMVMVNLPMVWACWWIKMTLALVNAHGATACWLKTVW